MKRRTFAIGALAALTVPTARAAAQVPGLGDPARAARREAERAARNSAERAVAKALFPLEESEFIIRRDAPILDGWDFGKARSAVELARAGNGFRLRPGLWRLDAQSFCLGVGRYERSGGAGYRSGVLRGRTAPAIASILAGAGRRPDIPQGDIQVLLWSLLAGTPVSRMVARAQAAARAILTADEFAAIDGGAFTYVPPEISARARRALPPEARDALSTYERLRAVASRPSSTYEEFEAIAVLRGEPRRSARDLPAGRWSAHPDRYHIRYFSDAYSRTFVEIMVGEPLATVRDELGRLVEMRFADGSYSRARYRADFAPLRAPAYPGIVGWPFQSIEIGSARPGGGPIRVHRVEKAGFAIAIDRAARRGEAAPLRYAAREVRVDGAFDLAQDDLLPGWAERARDAHGRLTFYRDRYRGATQPVDRSDIDNVFDLEHYRDGVEAAATGDAGDRLEWIIDHHERSARAVAEATFILDGLPTTSTADDVVYSPPTEYALPGGGGQVRGVSARAGR